jgi:hypothetical protein
MGNIVFVVLPVRVGFRILAEGGVGVLPDETTELHSESRVNGPALHWS